MLHSVVQGAMGGGRYGIRMQNSAHREGGSGGISEQWNKHWATPNFNTLGTASKAKQQERLKLLGWWRAHWRFLFVLQPYARRMNAPKATTRRSSMVVSMSSLVLAYLFLEPHIYCAIRNIRNKKNRKMYFSRLVSQAKEGVSGGNQGFLRQFFCLKCLNFFQNFEAF